MILIKNGCVHDGRLNVLPETDVLIDGGKIAAVGKNLAAPGAQVIDATGKHIMPGFINAISGWGVTGPDWHDADKAETSEPVTPEMNILYGFDQDGMNFQHAFEYGVTCAGVAPGCNNVLGGRAAVFKTLGRTPYTMLVKENAFMFGSASPLVKETYGSRPAAPMTMMGVFALLEAQLKKGEDYKQDGDYDPKAQAMAKVLSGEMPLFMNCPKRAQMDAVANLMKKHPKVKLVLCGAYGLDTGFEPTAKGEIPVIMGDYSEVYEDEKRAMNFKEVITLINNDAPVAIGMAGDTPSAGKENLLWNAILYVKHGLDCEKALRGITYMPAKILGIETKVGSVAPGLDADISIWSENPLKTYRAQCEATFIQGENALTKERYVTCW